MKTIAFVGETAPEIPYIMAVIKNNDKAIKPILHFDQHDLTSAIGDIILHIAMNQDRKLMRAA